MSVSRLILASSSSYRKRILEQMGVEVEQISPNIHEMLVAGEKPIARACRLGLGKARSVSQRLSPEQTWLVAGSDQVCHLNGEIFHKPGNFDKAFAQLSQFSGQNVTFTTSLALIDNRDKEVVAYEEFNLQFRHLNDATITKYLKLDQPFDCAGSIKVERLGASLLASTTGSDINSVYGFPIILFTTLLNDYGLEIFDFIL